MTTGSCILRQLEEIQLMKCSLLPGETFAFSETSLDWDRPSDDVDGFRPSSTCQFEVHIQNVPIWLQFDLPKAYPSSASPSVLIKASQDVHRSEQDRWQRIIHESLRTIGNADFPVFELMSSILPHLHNFHQAPVENELNDIPQQANSSSKRYHALLSSHHLVSPTKRRSMHKWASELHLSGFAKVGYPGIIYCEGEKSRVEDFVSNVKAMQWLALRMRFLEQLSETSQEARNLRWVELEKMGEVVQYMNSAGRGHFVTELGLGGSASG